MTPEKRRISSDHSNYAVLGFMAVGMVFCGFLGFAYRAPLDSASIATGRVSTESSTKPIQHLEGGIVREILVKDQEKVTAGQVLFRLEPTGARAGFEVLRNQMDADRALEARLAAERDLATTVAFPPELMERSGEPDTAALIADQERQFAGRRASLDNETKLIRARLEQSQREIQGLERQEASHLEQLESISAEIDSVAPLAAKGHYPRNKLAALKRERSRLDGLLGSIQGDLAAKRVASEEAELQIRQAEQRFTEQAATQLAEVRTRLREAREKIGVAEDVVSRIDIRAPQDGIVQNIKVRTAGAVVGPGDAIADLVPTGDELIIATRVSPLDIDSVMPGQTAEIRFSAFSSRRLPILIGRVEKVGADTMIDEVTRQPYYPATVLVDATTIPKVVMSKLLPGMQASVLIPTGERTMFEYLLGPLTDLFATSMREE